MINGDIILIRKEELKKAFSEWLNENNAIQSLKDSEKETLSINQEAKKLSRSHSTIKKMVRLETLTATSDKKRILTSSINEYLFVKT
jgi:hypothetical protein